LDNGKETDIDVNKLQNGFPVKLAGNSVILIKIQ